MTFAIAGHFSEVSLESLMNGWAHSDPEGAWAWLTKARADGMLLRTRAADRAPAEALLSGFAAGLGAQDSAKATAFVRQHLGDEGAESLVIGVGRGLVRSGDHTHM